MKKTLTKRYRNGVSGGIIINGPASAPYDEDKGTVLLTDWFHKTSDELYNVAQTAGPPQAQNGLINGTNTYASGGSRFSTTFASGKRYRLRLVNSAMDTMFRFSIDSHSLTVISADLVPIVPYTTDSINIGIGQRYDVIISANQDPGNYWLRAIPQLTCSSSNEMTLDIKGIVNYEGVDLQDPESSMVSYTDTCDDELISNLKPFVSLDAGGDAVEENFNVGIAIQNGAFKWTINSNTFLSDWATPSKSQTTDIHS